VLHPDPTRRPTAPALQGRLAAVVLLLACALPFLVTEYRLFQATMTLIYAVALFSLTILIGYSGQISLGHGAFYAIGAYTTAILMARFGVPYWATLPVSAVVCLIVGFVLGRPALKLEGHYLALATFALSFATPQVLKHKSLQPFTGGVQGLNIDKPRAPFGLPISADAWIYWFTLAVAVILLVLGRNLLRARVGRALQAIRDHPTAAAAMGVDTSMYKSLAFAVSALFTGIAGSLAAIAVQFVSPDTFAAGVSIMFLVGAVIGGIGSLWGPLFGAMFLQFVPNIAEDVSKSAANAVMGAFMIAAVFLLPQGVAGAFRRAWEALVRRGNGQAQQPPQQGQAREAE